MAQYQPLIGDGSTPPFRLQFRMFALVTVLLPFFAFLSCIYISVKLHSEESTATHCRVKNLLPSISAAIGGFQPQRYIWRICIALHSAPRLLVGLIYRHHYKHHLRRFESFKNFITVAIVLYYVENASLVGISYIASVENRKIHETCFTIFTISFIFYAMLSIGLSSSITNSNNKYEKRSIKAKVILFLTNITSLLTAVYCFYRHNKYCEPYVYTFFAFFEYVFVLTNMGFHLTAYWDFYTYEFNIGPEMFQKTR